eukprot:g5445.t1
MAADLDWVTFVHSDAAAPSNSLPLLSEVTFGAGPALGLHTTLDTLVRWRRRALLSAKLVARGMRHEAEQQGREQRDTLDARLGEADGGVKQALWGVSGLEQKPAAGASSEEARSRASARPRVQALRGAYRFSVRVATAAAQLLAATALLRRAAERELHRARDEGGDKVPGHSRGGGAGTGGAGSGDSGGSGGSAALMGAADDERDGYDAHAVARAMRGAARGGGSHKGSGNGNGNGNGSGSAAQRGGMLLRWANTRGAALSADISLPRAPASKVEAIAAAEAQWVLASRAEAEAQHKLAAAERTAASLGHALLLLGRGHVSELRGLQEAWGVFGTDDGYAAAEERGRRLSVEADADKHKTGRTGAEPSGRALPAAAGGGAVPGAGRKRDAMAEGDESDDYDDDSFEADDGSGRRLDDFDEEARAESKR